MKLIVTILLITFTLSNSLAQPGGFLKKIKQKAEEVAGKVKSKTDENKKEANTETKETTENKEASTGEPKAKESSSNLKVYSKFDFVPGSTVLYYDNFEKDNIGESPLGWITSSSAEVVTIEGLDGKWVKMASTSSNHVIRNKKQNWGNNFTIEFDILIVKNTYDPRIDFALINTGGNLVTDETILSSGRNEVYVGTILGQGGASTRVWLCNDNNINRAVSDRMSENLPYSNTVPVHASICVQGKRFRFWWNEKKVFDMQAVNEQYMPNQFGFNFGSVGGCDYYVSNIRIAKDIPDTRAKFEEGKLVSNLLFYTGTAKLRPESMGALLDVSKVLKDATVPVKIIGHTDADGDDASNLKLSKERADAIKDILLSQFNIDESKLATEGRGETQPIADNKLAEGKAQNRRVEFIFNANADKYVQPAGVASSDSKNAGNAKTTVARNTDISALSGAAVVKLQSKILNTSLPYAQIMKTGENSFTFIAGKEEGNSKENYFKIKLQSVNTSLKPETFNFKEINEKQPLYGTKKFAEISNNEVVLYYGTALKPYIYQFSPIISNGSMASYANEALAIHLPPVSPNCKLVIEKVENGKASGYFTMGIMIQGLKPVTKGDAMKETFTDGFSGEMKCTFSNVPVY
jgi:outer membrane protein OmpA-like peptidoglycan-associated protein